MSVTESTPPTISRLPHHQVDDDEFDVKPYLLLVWRNLFVVVVITLLFGAINSVYNWSQPAVHEATARIYVGEPGSTRHAETVGRVRLLASDPVVLSDVLKAPPLAANSQINSVAQFQKAIVLRSGTPANVLLVSVKSSDPVLAPQAALALAGRMVAAFREQIAIAGKAAKVELAKADEELGKARKAALDYSLAKQLTQRRDARSIALRDREELSQTLTMIVGERARLRAGQNDAATQAAARIGLAGLEARRDYLAAKISASEKAEDTRVLAEDELEYQRLETELSLAVTLRNDFAKTLSEIHAKAFNPAEPPNVLDASAPNAHDVTPGLMRNLGWALALGLLFSIVVVIGLDKWNLHRARG